MDNGFNLKEDRITFDCMPEDEQMTDAGFNALMGCTILWGLICNFFICMFLEVQVFNFVAAHPLLFILGYFVLAFNGAIIPADFFERVENDSATVIAYKEESVPTKEEKKSHKVAVRKSTKEEKIHPLITKNFINIADLKWWSIDEKIPPVGLPITLCVKQRPSTSNCSPYNTFPAKYQKQSSHDKYVFINTRGNYWWYLTEDEFRWTVDAGHCPDF